MKANIGLIGLAVMGQNLVLNMNDHGFKVAVYNRTTSTVDEFLDGPAKDTLVVGTHSLEALVDSLASPRIVMLMVKAGEVVDLYIDKLVPLLSAGDIIVDGGNSLFTDTNRRTADLKAININYIGTGVSGGEEGARHGPWLSPFFRLLALMLMEIHVVNGLVIMVPVIMLRWFITVLNMVICN